jgi:hypothetical protein
MTTSKKMRMEDNLNFCCLTIGRRPQKIFKLEDDIIKKWKMTSKTKWKMTSKNKMEDEPINQNQPIWL